MYATARNPRISPLIISAFVEVGGIDRLEVAQDWLQRHLTAITRYLSLVVDNGGQRPDQVGAFNINRTRRGGGTPRG